MIFNRYRSSNKSNNNKNHRHVKRNLTNDNCQKGDEMKQKLKIY